MASKKPSSDKFIKVSRKVADRIFNRFEIGVSQALLDVQSKHLVALEILGAALTRAGRHEESLPVDLRLTELAPKSSVAFYNLACSYSNLSMVDEAIDALSQSMKLGYRDFNHMMTDRDLNNVRRDPRFKKLLDRKWGKRQP